MKKIILFIILLVLNISVLNAVDCELVKESAQDVETYVRELSTEDGIYSQIDIYNMNLALYAVISNDYNNNVVTYRYEDLKDGLLTFKSPTIAEEVNFKIKIYSEEQTCTTEPLKTINVKTRKYNVHSKNNICNNHYDDIELCDPFYDIGDMSLNEFIKKVENAINNLETEKNYTWIDYIKMYYLFVLIPLLVIGGTYTFLIIKDKRRKKKYV